MARIVLTQEQQEAIDLAKRQGKRRIVLELTDAHRQAERKADANEAAEKAEIMAMGRQKLHARKSRLATIADQIREARAAAGMSLADVAEREHMTRQAVLRIESGENPNPKIETLSRIAEAIGKSLQISMVDCK